MPHEIPEPDWKIFRDLRELALERYCERVLKDVQHVITDQGKSFHERYVDLYQLVKNRDKELASSFDTLSRSTAMFQLACFQRTRLLTPAELGRLSEPTKQRVAQLSQI